jgi:hypothetical protein
VHREPVGHALDHGRAFPAAGAGRGLPGGGEHGEDVVAVHLDAGNAIGQGLLGQGARTGLILPRHRDRPLVVLAQEEGRGGEDAGEVQGLVEIAFGGGPVAEECDRHLVRLAIAGGVGEVHGVRDLGRHRDGDGQVVGVLGDGPALVVAGGVEQDRRQGHAPPDGRGGLPVRGHEPVVLAQGRHGADLARLLAGYGREGADPPLALEPEHPLVEPAGEEHGPVHGERQVVRDLG